MAMDYGPGERCALPKHGQGGTNGFRIEPGRCVERGEEERGEEEGGGT